jgi:hypothetical protein
MRLLKSVLIAAMALHEVFATITDRVSDVASTRSSDTSRRASLRLFPAILTIPRQRHLTLIVYIPIQ